MIDSGQCRSAALLVAFGLAGCSSSQPAANGRIVVAVTIDWEGAYLAPEGLDAIDDLRAQLPNVPVTHFVSAGYFTKATPDPRVAGTLTAAVREGDELAVHLHAWRSLAAASGVEPKLHPSFLTGTDQLVKLEEDPDTGFDTDLDVYDVVALRALLQTSRRLLEQTKIPVSKSFRAGGYLGTPRVLRAVRDEGFVVDSSAIGHTQLGDQARLSARVKELWPRVDVTSQPYTVETRSGPLLELPITALADHVAVPQLVAVFEAAHARLRDAPDRDVFIVLGIHQETAQEFAPRLRDAVLAARDRSDLAEMLLFATIETAAGELTQRGPL